MRVRIASSARLIAVWVRTISILGQAVRRPVSIRSSMSSCDRSEGILVGDQQRGGRMMLVSSVYSWLMIAHDLLARLFRGGDSSSELLQTGLFALRPIMHTA